MANQISTSEHEAAPSAFPVAEAKLKWAPAPNRGASLIWEDGVEIGARPRPQSQELGRALAATTGVHPAVIEIALSAVMWFLAVAWLNFTGGPEVDMVLVIVTGFFVMFFTLFLLAASMIVDDPRWKQPKASFTEFLNDEVPIDRVLCGGAMS
jgi:hypothetical protein